jgi:hypothetical protein
MMALSLSIRHRLLLSHLFAVVVLAGAFGAFVYYMAAQQVVERMRVQLTNSVTVLRNRSTTTPWMRRRATRPHSARWSHGCRPLRAKTPTSPSSMSRIATPAASTCLPAQTTKRFATQ